MSMRKTAADGAMKIMMYRAATGLAIVAVLMAPGLVACTPPGGEASSAQSAAETSKVAAYTGVFNILVGGTPRTYSGLTGPAESYLAADIGSASPDDAIAVSLNPEWLPGVLTELKAARAMRGDADMATADQTADRLIAAIEKIIRVESGLEAYYETRAYRADGLARGKAADPELSQAYQDAMAAMQQMEENLSVLQRRANQARVAQLESRGNVAEASLLKAMNRADIMTTAVIDNDPQVAERAAGELEAALADMRGKKARLKNNDNEDSYDLVIKSLTQSLASYRDNKPGSETQAATVVGHYNNAVEFSSNMQLPK